MAMIGGTLLGGQMPLRGKHTEYVVPEYNPSKKMVMIRAN